MTEDDTIQAVSRLSAALGRGDTTATIAILRELIGASALLGGRWQQFALLLGHAGEIDLAISAYELAIAQSPAPDPLRFALAATLAEHGRVDRAIDIVEALSPSAIGVAQRAHFLGVAHSQLGDFALAEQSFRKALQSEPLSGPSWHSLVNLIDMANEEALMHALIEAGPAIETTARGNRVPFLYATAKALNDVGRADEGFAALDLASALLTTDRRYDAEADKQEVAAIIGSPAVRFEPSGEGFSAPIFVLGFPRSGTTLVEQMLSQHPDVGRGGEANVARHIVAEVGGRTASALEAWAAKKGPDDAAIVRLRARFLHLLDQAYPGGGRHVDKSLSNSRNLGLLKSLFPQSPVVWLRRNPLDVAWSNYRTFFPVGMEWSNSQAALAERMILEDQLFDHWSRVLGEGILRVDYEDLVSRPDTVRTVLYRHCGLRAVSTADLVSIGRSPIATASFAQARRPIHAGAVGAAAPHRRHLQPFIDTYTKLGGRID